MPISDFNRVHQVIHGTLQDEATPGKACTLFACIGALILNKHYNTPARAVAGGFAMCVEPGQVMFFGRDDGGSPAVDENGFHMWVQTETHIIDFMSPLFREAFSEAQTDLIIPRRMFQKRFADEAPSLDHLEKGGDFYSMPDPELTKTLIDRILDRPINRDLIEIADMWFGKRRGKQKLSATIGSNDGLTRELRLPDTLARGAW